jgi:hypothetical protein
MVYFQPESHVASCRSLDGALLLSRFMQERFANNRICVKPMTFRTVIETDGKVSVHSSYPVNEIGRAVFRQAIVEFKTGYKAATA